MGQKNFLMFVGATFTGIALVCACTDDPSNEGTGGTTADSGASSPDAGMQGVDGAANDSGASDSGTSGEDADAGPTITSAVGPTGFVRVFNDFIVGEFYEDDTIVRASNAPECVIHLRSGSKPASPAGTLTIGGPILGSDGGADQPVTVDADPAGANIYFVEGPIFPPDDALLVHVEGAGTFAFPAMPVQVLRPPPADLVAVTAPALDDAGTLGIPSTKPLQVTWTAPANAKADARMTFTFTGLDADVTASQGALYCSYPLASGQATIPANVLTELRTRVGGTNARGAIQVYAGGSKEFSANGASYFLATSRLDAVGFEAFDVVLE